MQTPTERRIELQYKLEEILGTPNVYYRPPENFKLKYPCIVYRLKNGEERYADNKTYSFMRSYDVQLIHKTADSDVIEALMMRFPYIRLESSFINDNLIHENYVLYY